MNFEVYEGVIAGIFQLVEEWVEQTESTHFSTPGNLDALRINAPGTTLAHAHRRARRSGRVPKHHLSWHYQQAPYRSAGVSSPVSKSGWVSCRTLFQTSPTTHTTRPPLRTNSIMSQPNPLLILNLQLGSFPWPLVLEVPRRDVQSKNDPEQFDVNELIKHLIARVFMPHSFE
jgi:hypothetical protein